MAWLMGVLVSLASRIWPASMEDFFDVSLAVFRMRSASGSVRKMVFLEGSEAIV